ncbi:Glu/Leu/Phe/Val dehydrogenase dimerization domain-containing protein [Marinobacterium weihaiense]|uniref:Glu/Leu/Phe/Val dehydrogenase dimerization domain-containing protein n=1 Tax=Marinobacterium weihaiense TaxID=2851016 RepID=UPI0020B6749E|nr:Glu/Leu/Phe/Val dehydrogenase dimerization domain-containing protein [Marinobacterium weihaiense]
MLKQMENAGLSDLHFGLDPASGMKAIIAIHSTARGAAIGGCRFIHYAREQDAITDALRLARGMSYKAALAGLPHGGGKAVMIQPEGDYDRAALMRAFGRFVDQLGGRYITAMDSGTEVSDMDVIETATPFVSCTSASGDPAPHTALGVFEGIRAAVRHRLGRDDKIREIGATLTHLFEEAERSHQSVHHVADLHAEALLNQANIDAAQE